MFLVDFRRFYQRWNSLNYKPKYAEFMHEMNISMLHHFNSFWEIHIFYYLWYCREHSNRFESLFFNINAHLFHVNTVSTTCTNPNLVLIFATFTFASPDSENTLTLLVSGFFEIVTNSPPRVSSWKKKK